MLTRPKLIVPDQNGRAATLGSSTWVSGLVLVVLLLGNLFLPAPFHCGQAFGQLFIERSCCTPLFHSRQTRMFALRLFLDKAHQALAILVPTLFRLELAFRGGDAFFCQPEFL